MEKNRIVIAAAALSAIVAVFAVGILFGLGTVRSDAPAPQNPQPLFPTVSPVGDTDEIGTVTIAGAGSLFGREILADPENEESSEPWITVETARDACLGDTITVHGTTNLPAKETFITRIYEARFKCIKCQHRNESVDGCCGDQIPRLVTVSPGPGGLNRWLPEVTTSLYGFRAGEYYLVDVGDPLREIWNSTGFTVWETQESTRPWIRIDPVPHHYLGDTITFHGTTNLLPEETVQVAVFSAEFAPCPKSAMYCTGNVSPCCGGISSTVSIRAGACGVNRWSWDVNTAEHGFRANGEYSISAVGRNGATEQYKIFTVSGLPQPNITLNLPENDPGGYALRFFGQANTGSGLLEELVLIASSDSGKIARHNVPVFRDGTGYSWNYSLKKSEIVPYNFLTVTVSSKTRPEISIERTFLANNEPVYYPYNPYSP
jgi:hypothetical protein